MPLQTQLQTLISTALTASKNTDHCVSQYDVAINIAKYYAECTLSEDLDQLADGNIQSGYNDRSVDRKLIQKQREAINTDEYTEKMAKWAINEAKSKCFLRIVTKFKLEPHDPKTDELSNYLDTLYHPTTDVSGDGYKNAINGLKRLLITTRLKHRYPEQYAAQKEDINKAIDHYMSGEQTLAETKATLSKHHITDDAKLNTSLTKFCVLRTIETPEQVNAKILDEAAGIFCELFAKESDILGGLQRVVFQGDEILYRGIDKSYGEITSDDIRKKFNLIHRSQSSENPGIAQQAFILNHEMSPFYWEGRASQATAFALNPCIAAIYALELNGLKSSPTTDHYGWVFEYRPKPGQLAINLMKYNYRRSHYTEMDVEQVDPNEMIAAHRVKIKKNELKHLTYGGYSGKVTYEIVETILNPYYKHRGDETVNAGFFKKGCEVELTADQIYLYKNNIDQLKKINMKHSTETSFTSMDIPSTETAIAVSSRYQRNFNDHEESIRREMVSKKYIAQRRSMIKTPSELQKNWQKERNKALYGKTYEEWLDIINKNPYASLGEDGDTCVLNDRCWIWFNLKSNAPQWKCFLSIESGDYERAVNILKDHYFNNHEYMKIIDQAKVAIKKPLGAGGRLAIILYGQNTNATGWTNLLSNIENDFFNAGIKPRPLVPQTQAAGRSHAVDNKIPGSLYTYYKNDDPNWDRTAGYYDGVVVTGLAEAIANKQAAIQSIRDLSENESVQCAALLKITNLAGKEGAEAIQNNTDGVRDLFEAAHSGIALLSRITSQPPTPIDLLNAHEILTTAQLEEQALSDIELNYQPVVVGIQDHTHNDKKRITTQLEEQALPDIEACSHMENKATQSAFQNEYQPLIPDQRAKELSDTIETEKKIRQLHVLLTHQINSLRWNLFILFFRSYQDKRNALIDLKSKIEHVAQDKTVHDVLAEWKTTTVQGTLQTHRNRFFSMIRPNVKTKTEKLIETIENEYGNCKITSSG